MEIRGSNVVACLFRRPWLGIPLGLWVVVSVVYYWWLITRIDVLEKQNLFFKWQLHRSPSIRMLPPELTTAKPPEIPDLPGTICETIHISLVCMGKCPRNVTPILKSMLHHRQNPIHFHFIVDDNSNKIISKLFQSWDLPDVKYTNYNAQSYLARVSWIPNSHYSGIYTFVKLLYPDILPQDLEKVIVLDSDLTFLSDVAELWAMFRNMTDEQIIGVVENESDWYYQAGRWPALGRGYNTGVMLLHLKHIRATAWTDLWRDALQENLKILNKTALGDQDVVNAMIAKHPNIVYNISCHYNVQMSEKSLAKSGCYGEDSSSIKIIHWNSPKKYSVEIRDSDYFRSLHHAYVNLDSNLLREKLHRCWPSESRNETRGPHGTMCASFRAASLVSLRTHIYYNDYSYRSVDDFDVTLVLQLSMDRLPFLERLVRYWEGPLSAAIYLADCELNQFEKFIQNWAPTLSGRENIAYHLVFKHDGVHYPVNYLRNVALEHASTPYVFLMDADFVPADALYPRLRAALPLANVYPLKQCLVVAAFESHRYRATPPRTKQQLVARLVGPHGKGDIAPFRAHEWPRGHRATNYSRWVHATAPYEVEWEPDYEPYLVCHRTVPRYDTRFSGFGWNKVSHIVELRARGYKALVLPDVFVLHTTHAPSADITAFRADPHYRVCLALLKHEFLKDLSQKYNVTFEELKTEDWVERLKP